VHSQIVVDDLGYAFRPSRRRDVVALRSVTFNTRHRDFVALPGSSWCDTCMLLSMLGGFIPAEQQHAVLAQTVLQ